MRAAPLGVVSAAADTAALRVATALGAPCEHHDPGPAAGAAAWAALGDCPAVYVAAAGDPDLFVHARRTPHLVVSARALDPLVGSCIPADVVLVDAGDAGHDLDETELPVAPGAIVVGLGPSGGRLRRADGTEDDWGDGGVEGAPALGAALADALGAAVAVGLARGEGLVPALALTAAVGVALARAGVDGADDALAAHLRG